MPSVLREIKFVDLKRSDWDMKKSDRSKGEYAFETKIYYRNRDFAEGYIHPFKLKWCKYSEKDYPRPYASLESWRIKYKAQLLTTKDDYWPEGLVPDAEGKYVFGDMVAVKIPIEEHMRHRKEAVRRSEMQSKSVKDQFKAEAKQAGVNIPDEWIDEEVARMEKEARTLGI